MIARPLIASYRFQFHAQFPLRRGIELVPYLQRLGVSHVYSSPLLRTRCGSLHCYDVIDPLQINPEIGSEADLSELSAALHERAMGLILDIVPNHMALCAENRWWMEVLERGPASPYARYFDLRGHNGEEFARLVLPVLGAPVEDLLARGELKLELKQSGLALKYYERELPLRLQSYGPVLERVRAHLQAKGGTGAELAGRMAEMLPRLNGLGQVDAGPLPAEQCANVEQIKRELFAASGIGAGAETPEKTSGERPLPPLLQALEALDRGFLQQVLDEQYYELVDASTGLERINYRRFFDVNELGGIRVEDPEIFAGTHSKILEWVGEDKIDGLRVDHIDGLADPTAYLQRLAAAVRERLGGEARDFPIWVEKILTGPEWMPEHWPVAGTTGYETIHALRAVQVEPANLRAMAGIYFQFTGRGEGFHTVMRTQKRKALTQLFGAETKALALGLVELAREEGRPIEETDASLALQALTVHLPRYRTYVDAQGVHEVDRRVLTAAYTEARETLQEPSRLALDYLRRVVLLETTIGDLRGQYLEFVRRWQQYTGPAMAKGLEDTTFYVHMPLLSLNEVGSGPELEGLELATFHQHNQEKALRYPQGLCALSTHDTKRSEDARARLNVLAERPELWRTRLTRWSELNRRHKLLIEGQEIPPANDEMMIYQSLIGAWPLARRQPVVDEELTALKERVSLFLQKACREGKIHSTWYEVNLHYEEGLLGFVNGILGAENEEFLLDFREFVWELAFYGMLNSLGQVLIKNTIPGVPDHYQGQELWDFSLVDPDNRRPVDYARREELLGEAALEQWRGELADLLLNWRDGRVKLFVTAASLAARREADEVFARGEYMPLVAEGAHASHVLAYLRRAAGDARGWELVAVPRQTSALTAPDVFPLGTEVWKTGEDATELLLPKGTPGQWRNRLTGEQVRLNARGRLALAEVFANFPLALLTAG